MLNCLASLSLSSFPLWGDVYHVREELQYVVTARRLLEALLGTMRTGFSEILLLASRAHILASAKIPVRICGLVDSSAFLRLVLVDSVTTFRADLKAALLWSQPGARSSIQLVLDIPSCTPK